MKKVLLSVVIVFAFAKAFYGQESTTSPYLFTDVIDLHTTPVLSQGVTGTCWSFSTSSFLESEIYRLTGKVVDLSEMYTVRNTYPLKAENYVMRQGKAQFSEGGLAHDVLNNVKYFGLVPNSAYSGLSDEGDAHNHAEMVAVLKAMLDTYIENPGRMLSKKWKPAINQVLDVYLGKNVSTFTYDNKIYTPREFATSLNIIPENYVTLTSFSHNPFYDSFILNIPDNFSNGEFYNIPLDEYVATIDNALNKGYTVTLDCDVSEASFSSRHGVAVIPAGDNKKIALLGPEKEQSISQELRQTEFENYNTTDDHLMHIVGVAKDQNGTKYYKVKNSWGTQSDRTKYDGYIYMSVPYLKLKSISVLLHKNALPLSLKKTLKL